METFKELKERRLVQIVISYAVAGWIVMGVFSELVDREVLPGIVYRVLLVLYPGGMVAAVIMGWFHGEKGHQKVTRMEVVLLTIVGVLTLGAQGHTHAVGKARIDAHGDTLLSVDEYLHYALIDKHAQFQQLIPRKNDRRRLRFAAPPESK